MEAGRQRAAREVGRPESTTSLLSQAQLLTEIRIQLMSKKPETIKKKNNIDFNGDRILSLKWIQIYKFKQSYHSSAVLTLQVIELMCKLHVV